MEGIAVEYSLHLSSKLLEQCLYAARHKKETESMRIDIRKIMILNVKMDDEYNTNSLDIETYTENPIATYRA